MLKPCEADYDDERVDQPPSGGCVLKLGNAAAVFAIFPSRLQAAVC